MRQLSPKLAAWLSNDSSLVFLELALWFSTHWSLQQHATPLPSSPRMVHLDHMGSPSLPPQQWLTWFILLCLTCNTWATQSSPRKQLLLNTLPPDHSIVSPFLLLKSQWHFSTCFQNRPDSECWVSGLTFTFCMLCTILGPIYGQLLLVCFYKFLQSFCK